ncbi:MAG: 50S ribosomal protein L18 [bacterium]|nr:50S ribosomal protein L18 [bacterium]
MSTRIKRKDLTPREKRKISIRKRIFGFTERPRLCVYRSSKFTYAQVINDDTGIVLVSASSQEEEIMKSLSSIKAEGIPSKAKSSKSVLAAKAVGIALAKRAIEKKVEKVVFDRNGNLFHGRIKAVADGAREQGLQF